MRDFEQASAMLEERVVEAKAAGVPLVFEDLNSRLDVPDSENAFPELNRAMNLFERPDEEDEDDDIEDPLADLSRALKEGDLARFDDLLAPWQDALRSAESASHKPYLRSGATDWEYPTSSRLAPCMHAKSVVNLFGLQARSHVLRGDHASCVRDVQAANRISALVNQEPLVLGGLIGVITFSVAIGHVRGILAELMDRGEPIAEVADALLAGAQTPDWKWVVRSEVFYSVQIARNLDLLGGRAAFSEEALESETNPVRPNERARTHELPENVETRASMSGMLECFAAAFRAMNEQEWDVLSTKNVIIDWLEERHPEGLDYYLFPAFLIPSLHATGLALVNAQASHELVKAYGEVLEFRQREGRWPESLPQGGGHAVDPFDRQPLRYRVDGDQMRIWSIGRNLVDNGGVSQREAQNFTDYDNVIGYPPLPVWEALYQGSNAKDD